MIQMDNSTTLQQVQLVPELVTEAQELRKKWLFLALKRLADILIVLAAGSVLMLPMLLVGIIVRLESKGPAIFKQQRIGRYGKAFTIYKFRTMRTSAPDQMASRDFVNSDQYITRFGALLRRTSVDELPQLWNILVGDMSLVGYRPVCLPETDLNDLRMRYGVLNMRPGLTGLAQVSGRDNVTFEEKAQMDAQYVKSCGVKMDLTCLVKTVTTVISGEGLI